MAGPFLGSAELQILRLYLSRQVLVPLACAHVSFLLLILYCTWVQVSARPGATGGRVQGLPT